MQSPAPPTLFFFFFFAVSFQKHRVLQPTLRSSTLCQVFDPSELPLSYVITPFLEQ